MESLKLIGLYYSSAMVEKYHALKKFPEYEFPTGKIELNTTKHARKRLTDYNEQYAEKIRLPNTIKLFEDMYHRNPILCTANKRGEITKPHVFELAFEYGNLARIGVRFHASDKYDMILHIDIRNGNICTMWINDKNRSKNKDIDLSEYSNP